MADVRFDTPGRLKLSAWKQAEKLSQKDLAEALHPIIHQSMISRWLSGFSRPEVTHRLVFESLTRGAVRCRDWLTRAEREQIAGCTRQAERVLRKRGRRKGRKQGHAV